MSVLSRHVEEYLVLRRSLGHDLAEAGRLLPRFASYLEQAGVEFVTIQVALSWSQQPEAPAGTAVWAHRMAAVRGFARYMAGIDPRTEVPPAGAIALRRHWRPPFIYTQDDVLALMTAARDTIPEPLRAATYETLLGLLAATGMRIGEAIRLERGDVDWPNGVLRVHRSKLGKSRDVPLAPSTRAALERYAGDRRELYPHPRSDTFFVSLRGTTLVYNCVLKAFRRLCETTGIGAASTVRPRIHDLRHTFAVRTLLGWYRDGQDVQALLPLLSTYLGHVDPGSTYWYLSAAPELLAHAARMLDDVRAAAL